MVQSHPLLFDMHSRVVPDVLPEVSEFLFEITTDHNFSRLLFFFDTESELSASTCLSALESARTFSQFASATAINQTAPWSWKEHIALHRPELLIACTDNRNEVEFVMGEVQFRLPCRTIAWIGALVLPREREAWEVVTVVCGCRCTAQLVAQRILYGWDTQDQDWFNPTVVESTTSLDFVFFLRGAGTSDFFLSSQVTDASRSQIHGPASMEHTVLNRQRSKRPTFDNRP